VLAPCVLPTMRPVSFMPSAPTHHHSHPLLTWLIMHGLYTGAELLHLLLLCAIYMGAAATTMRHILHVGHVCIVHSSESSLPTSSHTLGARLGTDLFGCIPCSFNFKSLVVVADLSRHARFRTCPGLLCGCLCLCIDDSDAWHAIKFSLPVVSMKATYCPAAGAAVWCCFCSTLCTDQPACDACCWSVIAAIPVHNRCGCSTVPNCPQLLPTVVACAV
jgi:hypothetical protein